MKEVNLSRRDFLKDAGIIGAAAAIPKEWSLPKSPDILPFNPSLAPSTAPFLPKTETEIKAQYNINPDQATWNRVICLPSDSPVDHYRVLSQALAKYTEGKGWNSALAYPGKWFYPMMFMEDAADLNAGKGAMVMKDGQMEAIDAVRLDNWAIAANILEQGDPKMAVYELPWVAGQIWARLPVGTTQSEFAVAYAGNQNFREVKTGGIPGVAQAIIVEGNPGGLVNVYYCYPKDNQGHFDMYGFQRTIENVGNTLTVYVPETGYIGDFAPFVVIQQPVKGAHELAETEVFHRMGTDFKKGHPERVEGKNRIEEDEVLAAIQSGTAVKLN